MIGQTQNPLLIKTERAIQEKLKPQSVSAFQRIVTAGLKVMYSPQTRQMLARQLMSGGDPATVAGEGAAKLMGILISQSKGSMLQPAILPAVMPAATVLLCEGLDFMEKAGKAQVTPDLLAEATHTMGTALLQVLGATPERIAQAKAQQQAALQQQNPTGIVQRARGEV